MQVACIHYFFKSINRMIFIVIIFNNSWINILKDKYSTERKLPDGLFYAALNQKQRQ
ncbi:hypothetical protein D083_0557 [Dickeya solani RNS 08.23.3.1.A]|nr:hypothetical protein D083_0557 [Dickeya solani RNS 08.23.3.1.A]